MYFQVYHGPFWKTVIIILLFKKFRKNYFAKSVPQAVANEKACIILLKINIK